MSSKPKQINLTVDERSALISGIEQCNLSEESKAIILGLIDFNSWLQHQLLEKSISISRLKTMVFGEPVITKRNQSRTKANTLKPNDICNKPAQNNHIDNICDIANTSKPKSNRGGRMGYDRYLNSDYVNVSHTKFKPGEPCPTLCGGKLWSVAPGNVIKISGQGFAKATHYKIEKLRCNLCDFYTTAKLPDNVSNDKYDYAFKSQLCVLKYYLGLPLYRIQAYQNLQGIPLPDSTQWDLIEQVADCVYPVFNRLVYLAAQGRLAHLDDTNVRILSNITSNKLLDNKNSRRGTFTTGVISYYKKYKIYLFYSGKKHAGENMGDLLSQREGDLPPIHYMCDALSRNKPKDTDVILINCLAHARRKFVEVQEFFPEESQYIVNQFAIIYSNDARTKELGLTPKDRLKYHQEYSRPVLDQLKQYLQDKLDNNLIEANNSLGKAMRYTLKHWHALTQFIRLEGAPLDNNILEASLKIPIRIRKNAMFFKTEHGAYVGSILLSIIQTCSAAKVNPVDYLTTLQENKSQIFKEPDNWLPWNYNSQLQNQIEAVA
jgi:transposase